jgi:hypothetical protein
MSYTVYYVKNGEKREKTYSSVESIYKHHCTKYTRAWSPGGMPSSRTIPNTVEKVIEPDGTVLTWAKFIKKCKVSCQDKKYGEKKYISGKDGMSYLITSVKDDFRIKK